MAESHDFPVSPDDPVAELTSWLPAKQGGASYREHELKEISPTRLEFRITIRALLLFAAFVAIGILCLIGAFYLLVVGEAGWWILLVPALLFGLIGSLTAYFTSRPRVFDLSAGWYWKGYQQPSANKVKYTNNRVPLNMVHALQIVHETVTNEGEQRTGAFDSYELNLVMKNGSRVNIVDHGDIEKIRSDSDRLGNFLHVPVWDATLPPSNSNIKN